TTRGGPPARSTRGSGRRTTSERRHDDAPAQSSPFLGTPGLRPIELALEGASARVSPLVEVATHHADRFLDLRCERGIGEATANGALGLLLQHDVLTRQRW